MMINVTQTFLPPPEEYAEYLKQIWESKWVTNRGPLVHCLEAKLCERLGVENILAVINGTIALQLAIKALGLTGEVITTPFSYVATVSSIVWENCTPVFVDIDPDYLTIDENRIEEAITEKTSAILATHVYGNPCNVREIQVIAEKYGLKVIYDAAHCFGVSYENESILNWGNVSTLSFHATKLFHTGEGGAIVCRDKELSEKIHHLHNFGHNGPEEFFGLGMNGKMSEINAALGLAILPHLDEIVAKRKAVCVEYSSAIVDTNLRRPKLRQTTEWNFSYFPIIFPSEEEMLALKAAMNDANIFPRRYFYPSLNMLPYVPEKRMPVAEDISNRVLCFPLSAELTKAEIRSITSFLNRDG